MFKQFLSKTYAALAEKEGMDQEAYIRLGSIN